MKCSMCGGKGYELDDCTECDGSGCDFCGDSGMEKDECTECGGSGRT